jgi:hypothetical protein
MGGILGGGGSSSSSTSTSTSSTHVNVEVNPQIVNAIDTAPLVQPLNNLMQILSGIQTTQVQVADRNTEALRELSGSIRNAGENIGAGAIGSAAVQASVAQQSAESEKGFKIIAAIAAILTAIYYAKRV